MVQRFQVFFVALLLGIASCAPAQAQDAWIKIGSGTFDTAADVAGIALDGTMGGAAIRLEARQGNVVIRAVVVTYGEGRVHVEERPIVLNQGERTRPIALAMKDEIVRGLEIVLAPGGKGKATLEVWALGSTVPLAAQPASERGGVSLGKPVGKTEPIGAPSPADKDAKRAAEAEMARRAEELRRRAETASRAAYGQAKSPAKADKDKIVSPSSNREVASGSKTFVPPVPPGGIISREYQKRSGGHVSGIPVDRTASTPKAAAPKTRALTSDDTKAATSPSAPASRGGHSNGLETLDACVKAKTCTPVPVFFGTDRNQTDAKGRISFGTERAGRIQLGRVFVTVPSKNRTAGQINLPGSVDWLTGVPDSGDPKRHFTIPKTGVTLYPSEADFIADVKAHIASGIGTNKDHAFVYVHGYRVPWEFAAMRTAQIAYDLSPNDAPFGTPFLYSWPSQGAAADYITDLENSRIAIPHLTSFLRTVVEKTGASQVHVIAHSMGNFPVMHALAEIARTSPAVKFSQVILAAPDVEKREFEDVATGVVKVARSVTLYASSSDIALLLSRLVRRDKPRAGDAKDPPGPAIVAGMDTVDISRLSTGFMSYFSWNHDKYADSPVLLNDISTLFRDGHRAPNLRNLSFKMYQARFWQYQQ